MNADSDIAESKNNRDNSDARLSHDDPDGIADSYLWNERWDDSTRRLAMVPVMRDSGTSPHAVSLALRKANLRQVRHSVTRDEPLSFSRAELAAIESAIADAAGSCAARVRSLNAQKTGHEGKGKFSARLRLEARVCRAALQPKEMSPAEDVVESGRASGPLTETCERLQALQLRKKIVVVGSLEVGLHFPALPHKLVSSIIRRAKEIQKERRMKNQASVKTLKADSAAIEEDSSSKKTQGSKVNDNDTEIAENVIISTAPMAEEMSLRLHSTTMRGDIKNSSSSTDTKMSENDVGTTLTICRRGPGEPWLRLVHRHILVAVACPSVLQAGLSVQLVLVEELFSGAPLPSDVADAKSRVSSENVFHTPWGAQVLSSTSYHHDNVEVDPAPRPAMNHSMSQLLLSATSVETVFFESVPCGADKAEGQQTTNQPGARWRSAVKASRSYSYLSFAAPAAWTALGSLVEKNCSSDPAVPPSSASAIPQLALKALTAFASVSTKIEGLSKSKLFQRPDPFFRVALDGTEKKANPYTQLVSLGQPSSSATPSETPPSASCFETTVLPIAIPSSTLLQAMKLSFKPSTVLRSILLSSPAHVELPSADGVDVAIVNQGRQVLHASGASLAPPSRVLKKNGGGTQPVTQGSTMVAAATLAEPFQISSSELLSTKNQLLHQSNSSQSPPLHQHHIQMMYQESSSPLSFAMQLFHDRITSRDESAVNSVIGSFGDPVATHVTIFARSPSLVAGKELFVRMNLSDASDATCDMISSKTGEQMLRHFRGYVEDDTAKDSGRIFVSMANDGAELAMPSSSSSRGIVFSVHQNFTPSPTLPSGGTTAPHKKTRTKDEDESHLKLGMLSNLREQILPQCVHGAAALITALEPVTITSSKCRSFIVTDAHVVVDDFYLADGKTTVMERNVHHCVVRSSAVLETNRERYFWFMPGARSGSREVHKLTNTPVEIACLVGKRLWKVINADPDNRAVTERTLAVVGAIQQVMTQTSKIFHSSGLSGAFLRGNILAMLLLEAAATTKDPKLIEMASEDCSVWFQRLKKFGIHSAEDLVAVHDASGTKQLCAKCGIPADVEAALFRTYSKAPTSSNIAQPPEKNERRILQTKKVLSNSRWDFTTLLPGDSVLQMPSRCVVDLKDCGGQLVPVILPHQVFFPGHGDFLAGDVVLVGKASQALVDECLRKFGAHSVFESHEFVLIPRDDTGGPLIAGIETLGTEASSDLSVWSKPENMQYFVVRNAIGNPAVFFRSSGYTLRTPTAFELSQLHNKDLFTPLAFGNAMYKQGKLLSFFRGPGLQDNLHQSLLSLKPQRVVRSAVIRH